MANYESQGARARSDGHPRVSCRYKAQDIRREWLAGWDKRDAELQAMKRRQAEAAAVLRWEDHTSYSQGERGVVEPRCWMLVSSRLAELSVTLIHRGQRWEVTVDRSRSTAKYMELDDMPVAEAKAKAIDMLRAFIAEYVGKLEDALAVLGEEPREP